MGSTEGATPGHLGAMEAGLGPWGGQCWGHWRAGRVAAGSAVAVRGQGGSRAVLGGMELEPWGPWGRRCSGGRGSVGPGGQEGSAGGEPPVPPVPWEEELRG